MKHVRNLAILALVVLAVSCAQPPKAEVDAARAKVGAAQKDADIVTYAGESLQQAKDALARMEKFLTDRKYPEAKSAALQASNLADSAKQEVAGGKAKAKNEATDLIATAKKQLSALLPTISAAKRARPVGLDLASLDKDLAAARAKLADADSAFGAGRFAEARDNAAAVQASFSDLEKRVSDAIQAARKKK